MRTVVLVHLLLMALLAIPAATATAPHVFPDVATTLVPTADRGQPSGYTHDALLMRAAGGASGQKMFLPALGMMGMDGSSIAWISESAAGATYELRGNTLVRLEFAPVNVNAVGTFTVSLSAIDRSGRETHLASAQRTFNLPRLPSGIETVAIATDGLVLPIGQALKMELRADALDVVTVLNYGSGTSSALAVAMRVLDTDGDGIPDDVDPCRTHADCDGDGVGDGDTTFGNGTTSVHQWYRNFYNSTAATGPPGSGPGQGSVGPILPPGPGDLAGVDGAADGQKAQVGRIALTAGGLALATGTTVSTISFLRRRP